MNLEKYGCVDYFQQPHIPHESIKVIKNDLVIFLE